MPRTMDDDALMIRTAEGEETAFRLLVQRWERDVLSFLIHMLGSIEEAEDLVQDTFVQVFRKAGSYQAILSANSSKKPGGMRLGLPVANSTQTQSTWARANRAPSTTRLTL